MSIMSGCDPFAKAPEVHYYPGLEVTYYPGLEIKRKPLPPAGGDSVKDTSKKSAHSSPKSTTTPSPSKAVLSVLCGVLVAFILVSAGLGGGLGVRLATCERQNEVLRASSSTSTSTDNASTATILSDIATPTLAGSGPTATGQLKDFKAPAPSMIDTLRNDCTSSPKLSMYGDTFNTTCNVDFNNGRAAAEGGIVVDIVGITAYPFIDCLNACSGLNDKAQHWGFSVKCRSVTFALHMARSTASEHANCWLKNGTLKNPGITNSKTMSAILVSEDTAPKRT